MSTRRTLGIALLAIAGLIGASGDAHGQQWNSRARGLLHDDEGAEDSRPSPAREPNDDMPVELPLRLTGPPGGDEADRFSLPAFESLARAPLKVVRKRY